MTFTSAAYAKQEGDNSPLFLLLATLALAILIPVLGLPAVMPKDQPPALRFALPEATPYSAEQYVEPDSAGTVVATEEISLNNVGPAARPFFLAGSFTDRTRAERCMTMAIYYEAASESTEGQRAVAQVVMNRVRHPSYPDSVCGVVFQGSERSTGCQFTFTCDGSLNRVPSQRAWQRSARVARAALGGYVHPQAGLATHYHRTDINPYWADSLETVGTIGLHRFYRWRGQAGTLAAFADRYGGNETLPVRHFVQADHETKSEEPSLAAVVASTIASQHLPGPVAIMSTATEPVMNASPMLSSGAVLEQFAQSGQWIAEPGS